MFYGMSEMVCNSTSLMIRKITVPECPVFCFQALRTGLAGGTRCHGTILPLPEPLMLSSMVLLQVQRPHPDGRKQKAGDDLK